MTSRSIVGLAVLLLAGCQDYKFNPVGKCIIQPGSARIQLSSVSTADILFVVDDSGSMLSEQKRLADNFGSFINALAQTQAQRKSSGLDPLEFHIAITTSSIFEAYVAAPVSGSPPYACGAPTSGQCTVSTPYSSWTTPYAYACTTAGANCVDVIDQYWPACSAGPSGQYGQGVRGAKYPAGNFMAAPSVNAPANPRVLHFTKDLAWETWATASQDPRITTLVSQFQDNIKVGACGSGMEQHFEGGRLAVQKALAGQQPGVTPSEWPHPGAKLVIVWVGDEDDCSNPKDPNKSLAFTPFTGTTDPNPPGDDVCVHDDSAPIPKKFPIADYASYFTSLGRPFSAAFIYSSNPSSCQADASGNVVCTPGACSCQCPPSCNGACGPSATGACQIDAACGGKSAGTRFHDLSAAFRGKGVSTLDGSVCDWDFGKTLTNIAELVKPPAGLTLPTQPAATQVTMLRIQSSDGTTSRLCTGPGPGSDWQFVDCKTGAAAATGITTSCITINHATGHCEANPGETYVAQYLGMVPSGGCASATECAAALGGTADKWTCETPNPGARGTCLCATTP